MKKLILYILIIVLSCVGCDHNENSSKFVNDLQYISFYNQCDANLIYSNGKNDFFLKDSKIYTNLTKQDAIATKFEVLTFTMDTKTSTIYYFDKNRNIRVLNENDELLVSAEIINAFIRSASDKSFDITEESISWLKFYDDSLYINIRGGDLIKYDIGEHDFAWISNFVDFAVISNKKIHMLKHARYPGVFAYDISKKEEAPINGSESLLYTNMCLSTNGIYVICRKDDIEGIQLITYDDNIKNLDITAKRILLCYYNDTTYAALFDSEKQVVKCRIYNLNENVYVKELESPTNQIPIAFNIINERFVFDDSIKWYIHM